MKDFPIDRRGAINWVKAIQDGIINPRMSRTGDDQMNIMDMDILFKNTGEMPWVRFPHLAHWDLCVRAISLRSANSFC